MGKFPRCWGTWLFQDYTMLFSLTWKLVLTEREGNEGSVVEGICSLPHSPVAPPCKHAYRCSVAHTEMSAVWPGCYPWAIILSLIWKGMFLIRNKMSIHGSAGLKVSRVNSEASISRSCDGLAWWGVLGLAFYPQREYPGQGEHRSFWFLCDRGRLFV